MIATATAQQQCPFYGSYSEADPVRIADEGVQQFKEEKYEVRDGQTKRQDRWRGEGRKVLIAAAAAGCVAVVVWFVHLFMREARTSYNMYMCLFFCFFFMPHHAYDRRWVHVKNALKSPFDSARVYKPPVAGDHRGHLRAAQAGGRPVRRDEGDPGGRAARQHHPHHGCHAGAGRVRPGQGLPR